MSSCAQLASQLRSIESLVKNLKKDVDALKANNSIVISNFKETDQAIALLGKAIQTQQKSLDSINQVLQSQTKINKSTEYKFGEVIKFSS